MEITEKFLEKNGFIRRNDESWGKYEVNYSAIIRRTIEGDGWQISIVTFKTRQFGVGISGIADDDAKTFYGYVDNTQDLKMAFLACGIKFGTDWRERMPYYVKQSKGECKFMIYKREGKDELYTGQWFVSYDSAMAEMRRLNAEEQL